MNLRDARSARKALQVQWDKHRKICRQCRQLTDSRNRYCPEGWELAKSLQQARALVAQLQEDIADQVTLF